MSGVVVDASVALAWCLPDEANADADEVLRRLAREAMVVPAVWAVEVANALVVAKRRKRAGAGEFRRFLDILAGLEIREVAAGYGEVIGRLPELALEYELSAYDAAYLELALRMGLPLATLDRRLRRAAEGAGVEVVI